MLVGFKMETVYIVEPDDGIREAIQTFLESFNVPVQVFSDADEFLRTAGIHARGCLIVEAELPGLDGLGLVKHLRGRNIDIPFILLSDEITPEYERRAIQDGASAVLKKPLTNDNVITQLQRFFGNDCCGLAVAASRTEVLSDGAAITVRPIQPSDRAIEQKFVLHLSQRSKRLRFFTAMRELSNTMLDRFTHIHFPENIAFIATVEDSSGVTEIGVARYSMTDDNCAEFAVAVADAWQGRGVGTLLMRHLIRCADTAGIKKIKGTVLRENRNMLKFARGFGFETSIEPDDATLVSLSRVDRLSGQVSAAQH